MKNTKTFAVVALSALIVFGLSSCKSKESLYKKAYEKAQAQNTVNTNVTEEPATINVTPVQPTAPTTVTVVTPTTPTATTSQDNIKVQSETVQVIDGAGLKAYSVVCGSFGLQANATGLQQKLKEKGFQAQIALNPERKLYRVIASTHNTKDEAISFRNKLRESYPDAWLLYKK